VTSRKSTTPVLEFTLRLPRLTTRRVWLGAYSEMTGTVIMVFSGKPTLDKVLRIYSVRHPKYVGSVWVEEWIHWFGSVEPLVKAGILEKMSSGNCVVTDPDCDCRQVIPARVRASWGQFRELIGLNVRADN
jgi:hypothetical protein